MPVTKAKKKEQVEKLSADLKNVSSAVVATYSKLTVAQDYELRKALRGAGAKYQVVKNTLAERAAKGTKIEEGLKNLTGVTSIAYTTGDPVAMAKALTKYAKDTPEFTFKVGVVEGRVISIKEIEALASMPSKEEIYSKLLFLISSPAQRLVTVMNAVGRDVAVVLGQGVEKGKFSVAIAPAGIGARARPPALQGSGRREPSERDLVIRSQGLRGFDLGRCLAPGDEPAALETWPR